MPLRTAADGLISLPKFPNVVSGLTIDFVITTFYYNYHYILLSENVYQQGFFLGGGGGGGVGDLKEKEKVQILSRERAELLKRENRVPLPGLFSSVNDKAVISRTVV